VALAEKVDRKQMTLAEAEFELTKLKSGAFSEGEKREAAESVASSQAAAAAAACQSGQPERDIWSDKADRELHIDPHRHVHANQLLSGLLSGMICPTCRFNDPPGFSERCPRACLDGHGIAPPALHDCKLTVHQGRWRGKRQPR
jgi:hypothetical protein